jgi:hypothetical protein|tara:strand:+ start:481 stop:702 length:222 start_codon:yes stop_codon:yes gene_type:complete
MDIRSIHSCIKYFESTLGKAPRMVKEDDKDIYCGPVLTDFAKELVERVENKKKLKEALTKKSSESKNYSEVSP